MKVARMENTQRSREDDDRNVWKGFAAGLIAGLVASWTMNRFQDVWSTFTQSIATPPDKQSENPWSESADELEESPGTQDSKPEPQDDTTVRTASAISEGLFNHKLTPSEKKIAGPAVHYSLGTGVGGLYGAAAEIAPQVTAGAGLPFGAAFWLVVDEGAVPLLGLSKGPTAYPLSTHAYALSSHFVYGLTAEIVRRAVRNAL
jgi:putative membrane protein